MRLKCNHSKRWDETDKPNDKMKDRIRNKV